MKNNNIEECYKIIKNLKFENYRNTKVIEELGGEKFTVEDALKAAVISGTNIFLLSGSGAGKTQLESDILYGMFGGDGVWTRGGLNPKVESLYKVMNLEALRTAKTTEDIEKLTSRVEYKIVIMDELNNCPGPVQQQFFNICEGYIEFKGQRYQLGKGGYFIGIASGNPKNGEYTHAFEVSRALIDRTSLILDLDYYYKTPEDGWDVYRTTDNPKVKLAEKKDMSDDIIKVWEVLNKQENSVERIIAALYLEYGLDYCSKIPGNSKRAIHTPTLPECEEKGGLCAYLNPITTRQGEAWIRYSKGIEMVARAKGADSEPLDAFLVAVKIAVPHSGVLRPEWVTREFNGSYCEAANEFYKFLKIEFEEKANDIVEAISEAQAGELSGETLNKFNREWNFMKPKLEELNKEKMKEKEK